jgi:hypothetical protein
MERAYDSLGKPGIFRNDRFWLAGDHVVDPRINHLPKVKALLASSKRAKQDFRMTDNQGNNVSRLRTDLRSFDDPNNSSTRLCTLNFAAKEHNLVC